MYKSSDFSDQNLQVCVGPRHSPVDVLCIAKQWLYDQNYKSVWAPALTLWFCANKTACLAPDLLVSMAPSPHLWFCANKTACFCTKITSLYGSQTSPVDLCMQNSVLSTRISSLYIWVPALTCCFVHPKERLYVRFYKSLWVPDLTCGFVRCKTSVFSTRLTSLYGSQTSSVVFVHAKQRP